MTRRGLFGMLAAAALDPERLLWVPGQKLISIPAPVPRLPVTFFSPDRVYSYIRPPPNAARILYAVHPEPGVDMDLLVEISIDARKWSRWDGNPTPFSHVRASMISRAGGGVCDIVRPGGRIHARAGVDL